ncbi:hypothetical protein GZ77_24415 [Endozoicomonas montiporae]|uniref:Uncharacterized protein n=2 Tax=Endozoicomonas montiporae TaxID=1027273 RepID=A0A081MZP0_9GAMM|nr:hypothetical protein [Endozoicomonas montiporae]AMO54649.1 hypothetical protein EZMO1_0397 [Endozoicomonas montiporae CL-33]KEQ11663.1 hypothetical protein GZ77_24415 [Endozoicomonas montiporae]
MSSNDSSSIGGSPYTGKIPDPPPPPPPGVKNGETVTSVPAKPSFPPPAHDSSKPPGKTIGQRTPSETAPTLNVNEQKRITQEFTEQAHEARQLNAQVNFIHSIPGLLEQLEQPEQMAANTPFFILVNDGGKQVSLIPPSPELLKDKDKYQLLKTQLKEQLNAVQEHYKGSEGKALGERAQDAEARLAACRNELENAQIPEPPITYPRIIFTFSSLLNATSSQPARPATGSAATEEGEYILEPLPPTRRGPPKAPPGQPPTKVFPDGFDPSKLTQQNLKKRTKTDPPKPVSPEEVSEEFRPTGAGLGKVTESFLQPSKTTGYASIWHSDKEEALSGKLASVNCGNPDLALGHGGINREFADTTPGAMFYKTIHERMLTEAKTKGEYVSFRPGQFGKHASMLSGAAAYQPPGAKNNEGTIFIDVFNKSFPEADPANGAMIYAIPPDGSAGANSNYPDTEEGKQKWLASIKQFSANILLAQNQWNIDAKKHGLPQLPILRSPLIGGGYFMHPKADKNELAAAIRTGFDETLSTLDKNKKLTITDIQYEETAGEHFKNVKPLKSKEE